MRNVTVHGRCSTCACSRPDSHGLQADGKTFPSYPGTFLLARCCGLINQQCSVPSILVAAVTFDSGEVAVWVRFTGDGGDRATITPATAWPAIRALTTLRFLRAANVPLFLPYATDRSFRFLLSSRNAM